MITYLKESVQFVKLFVIVANGQTPRFDDPFKKLLKTFEDTFSVVDADGKDEFWKKTCILFTRWSHHPLMADRRKKEGIDENLRKQNYLELLNESFPKTQGIDLKCYFTDVFDLQDEEHMAGTEDQI